jgi:predicted nucleic acid-binding protein
MSNFAPAQAVSVVYDLWGQSVCTTPDAFAEYHDGVAAVGLPDLAWEDIQIIKPSEDEQSFGIELSARPGKGERSCLSVARMRNGVFATDDLFARQVAQGYRIAIIGTVGILQLCVKRNILSSSGAQTALEQMIAFGYRSPIDDLSTI